VRERRGASVAVRVGTDIARRGARHRRVGVVQAAVDEVARGSVDADGVVAVAAAQVVDAGGAEVRDRVVRAVPVDRVLAVPLEAVAPGEAVDAGTSAAPPTQHVVPLVAVGEDAVEHPARDAKSMPSRAVR